MKKSTLATIEVILAGCFWGLLGLFVKNLSDRGFDSKQITFIRMGVAMIFSMLVLSLVDKTKLKIHLRDIWMFFLTGFVSIFLHNLTYFYAIIIGEASVATVLIYTSPVFIMIMSAIFYKDKITGRKIVCLCMILCGCVLTSGLLNNKNLIVPKKAVFIGIFSGFLYSLYTIFCRFALKKYDSSTVSLYTYFFSLLGSLFVVRIPQTISLMFSDFSLVLLCIGIGTIGAAIPFFLYTDGLEGMDSSKASILVAIEPIVSCIVGMTILHEDHSLLKIIGIIISITSIVLLNLEKDKV